MNRIMGLGLSVAVALASSVAWAGAGKDDPYATTGAEEKASKTDDKLREGAATAKAKKAAPQVDEATKPSSRASEPGAASGEPDPSGETQRAVDGNPPGRWVWGS